MRKNFCPKRHRAGLSMAGDGPSVTDRLCNPPPGKFAVVPEFNGRQICRRFRQTGSHRAVAFALRPVAVHAILPVQRLAAYPIGRPANILRLCQWPKDKNSCDHPKLPPAPPHLIPPSEHPRPLLKETAVHRFVTGPRSATLHCVHSVEADLRAPLHWRGTISAHRCPAPRP